MKSSAHSAQVKVGKLSWFSSMIGKTKGHQQKVNRIVLFPYYCMACLLATVCIGETELERLICIQGVQTEKEGEFSFYMNTRLYTGTARKWCVKLQHKTSPVRISCSFICLSYLSLLSAMSLLRCVQQDESDKSSSYGTVEGTTSKAIHTKP